MTYDHWKTTEPENQRYDDRIHEKQEVEIVCPECLGGGYIHNPPLSPEACKTCGGNGIVLVYE